MTRWALSLLAVGGCYFGATPTIPSGVCSGDGWCWEQPLPQADALFAVWGFGPNDVWAGGRAGKLLHYDGSTWRRSRNPTWNEHLWFASAGEDVSAIRGIWGARSDDVWAVTETAILHWDGHAWLSRSADKHVMARAVWGSSADDVWVVGEGDVALHWDGHEWTTSKFQHAGVRMCIWGTARDDVWAIGHGGAIDHWDGTGWRADPNEIHDDLIGVFGSSRDDVWAVGERGLIVHRDAKAWSVVRPAGARHDDSPIDPLMINRGWAFGPHDAWAVVENGDVLRWDGHAWASAAHYARALFTAWAASARDVWIAGDDGAVLRFDPGGGTRLTSIAGPVSDDLFGVWGTSEHDVWAVGDHGTILHRDERGWHHVDSGTRRELYGASGTGPDDAWIVGDHGTILHWNGHAWQSMPSGTDVLLLRVWAAARDDVWAVGSGEVVHYDGRSWTVDRALTASRPPIDLITGAARDDAWALGKGVSLHWNGTGWTNVIVPMADGAIFAAWFGRGAGWAVGGAKLLHRRDPGDWQIEQAITAIGSRARSLWGTAADDVWVCGIDGLAFHWNGHAWRWSDTGTVIGTNMMWGRGDDLFIVGASGMILHRRPRPR